MKHANQVFIFEWYEIHLTRRAFENTEFECLNDYLVGPLFIALSLEAPSDAARLLKGIY